MKTLVSVVVWVFGTMLLTSCASVNQVSTRPARLQVTVEVPPSMNPIREDDVADAFGYRVATALREQGLPGPIRYVESGDPLVPTTPVLAVHLREWRVDRIGNVDCTFQATLQTPSGNRSLGLFTGTSMMMWSRRDWSARADGFEDAARDAMDNLGKKIMATGLLPDMSMPRRR